MTRETSIVEETAAPTDRPVETLDVADLGPPEPASPNARTAR